MHYKMEEGDREVSSFIIYPVGSVCFLPHEQSFWPKNGKTKLEKGHCQSHLLRKSHMILYSLLSNWPPFSWRLCS